MDVIAYTCDLGQGQDIEGIRKKALRTGAIDAVAEDAPNLFIHYFVWPSLMAGALFEGSVSAGHGAGATTDRSAHGPRGAGERGERGHGASAPSHRQGKRPGPI